MDNIYVANETTLAQQKYDEDREKIRVINYDKAVRIVYLSFGIFCALAMLFLTISFFFLNIFGFFDIYFNFPSIIAWIDSLPLANIPSFKSATAKFILGLIFAAIYLAFAVKLIIRLFKTKKNLSALCELKNTLIDHKKEFFELVHRTINSFSIVISLILVCKMTKATFLSLDIIAVFGVGFLIYALYTVGTNLYTCYDVHKEVFHKKVFALNITKQFILTVVCIALTVMAMGNTPHLVTLLNNYAVGRTDNIIIVILNFILPLLQFMFAYGCITYLRNIINIHNLENSPFEFYGVIYKSDVNAPIIELGKKMFNKIIRYTVFFGLIVLVSLFFEPSGIFKIPTNIVNDLYKPILYFASTILMGVAFRLIAKTKEVRIIPLV